VINQFDGYGELGAEVAITRAFVIHGSFRFRGVLGMTSSVNSSEATASGEGFDNDKLAVGNSIGRNASYTVGAGLGLYF
jgi:hypothetical protein